MIIEGGTYHIINKPIKVGDLYVERWYSWSCRGEDLVKTANYGKEILEAHPFRHTTELRLPYDYVVIQYGGRNETNKGDFWGGF